MTIPTSVSPRMDATKCVASELASYLMEHRFQGNAGATANFFRECSAAIECLANERDDAIATLREERLGPSSSRGGISVSAVNPRGRFQLVLHERGFRLVGSSRPHERMAILGETVRHMIAFPKPEDCRRPPAAPMVLIVLQADQPQDSGSTAATLFCGKTLDQVCFQLPSDEWRTALSTSLSRACISVESTAFKSWKGMPFVKCHYGVKDGVLFPLEQGLLFFRPALFLPKSRLHSLSCDGGSGLRFVTMAATLELETVEFTNIDREEMSCLNEYIQNLKAAMERENGNQQGSETSNDVGAGVEETLELSERQRSKRTALVKAKEATRSQLQAGLYANYDDEDDDDELFEPKQDSSEEDDDDDDDDSGVSAVDIIDAEGGNTDLDASLNGIDGRGYISTKVSTKRTGEEFDRQNSKRAASREANEMTRSQLQSADFLNEGDDDDDDDYEAMEQDSSEDEESHDDGLVAAYSDTDGDVTESDCDDKDDKVK